MLFGDIVHYTMKSIWPQLTNLVIIFSQIGACCAYLIFLYQSTNIAFLSLDIHLSKLTIFILTLLLIVPLSLVRKISYFHKVSQFGFYVNLITFLVIVIDCLHIMSTRSFSFGNVINLSSTIFIYSDSFQFIGVACLTFQCNITILPIRNDMTQKHQFDSIQITSLLILFIVQFIVTTVSITCYQDQIDQIVIFNIENSYLRSLTMLAYGVCIMMTYALQQFPAVQIIEDYFSKHKYNNIDENEENQSLFALDSTSLFVRGSLMLAIYIIAYKIPDLSKFINLIGSLFGSIIQFLIPLLAHWICFKDSYKPLKLQIEYLIMFVFTVFAVVFGTYESLSGMI